MELPQAAPAMLLGVTERSTLVTLKGVRVGEGVNAVMLGAGFAPVFEAA
jgi:hypothetical protein